MSISKSAGRQGGIFVWRAYLVLLLCLGAVFPAFGDSVRPALAAGESHMLALRADGTVWIWGDNFHNQLGDATVKRRLVPGQVSGLSDAVAVSARNHHNLVLLANGEVWSWGYDIGDAPTKVQGLADVVAIAAANYYNLALKKDGTVWSWGLGVYHPESNTIDKTLPTQIEGLSDIVGIAASAASNAALKRDGSVWTWGGNSSGQLGDGTRTYDFRSQPTKIAIANVSRLVAGEDFLFAELTDGSVWTWGNNSVGQLGDGLPDVNVWNPGFTPAYRLVPAPVDALKGYKQLAAGHSHALGVAPDGGLRAWGYNDAGYPQCDDFGDVSYENYTLRTSPVAVKGAPKNPLVVQSGKMFNAVIDADGVLWTWGFGPLGRDLNAWYRPLPKKIPNLKATHVSAGQSHSLAISDDGAVSAWGSNGNGQLGVIGVTTSASPLTVDGLKATAVAACEEYSLALTAAGEVYAWGDNRSGQLGIGSATQQNTPIRIAGLSGIAAIGCGDAHSVALGQDGRVWSWGSNAYSQLGNGVLPSAGSAVPLVVSGLDAIHVIAVGGNFTLALAYDGKVYAWGRNNFGQLGDGGNDSRATPVSVLNGAERIVAGYAHAYAKSTDGHWHGWGENYSGQLGTGDKIARNFPVAMAFPAEFTGLAANGGEASSWHVRWYWGDTLGVTADGDVWSWGSNHFLQLADVSRGMGDDETSPHLISGISGIRQVAVGKKHTLAVAATGEVWSWGFSGSGRLGQEVDFSKPEPALTSDYSTPFNLGGSNFTAHAQITGAPEAPTISVSLSVAPGDQGKTGKIYAAYQLPDGTLYFLASGGWVKYDGKTMPFILETVLGEYSSVLWSGKDLSGMAGAVFYIGYGISESDLLDNRKYSAIHTVLSK